MTRGTAMLLVICILASIISFAQSDSLIKKTDMKKTFTENIMNDEIIIKHNAAAGSGFIAMVNK